MKIHNNQLHPATRTGFWCSPAYQGFDRCPHQIQEPLPAASGRPFWGSTCEPTSAKPFASRLNRRICLTMLDPANSLLLAQILWYEWRWMTKSWARSFTQVSATCGLQTSWAKEQYAGDSCPTAEGLLIFMIFDFASSLHKCRSTVFLGTEYKLRWGI